MDGILYPEHVSLWRSFANMYTATTCHEQNLHNARVERLLRRLERRPFTQAVGRRAFRLKRHVKIL